MCKREGAEKGEESRGGRRNHSSSSKPRSLPLPRPISWVLSLPGMRINCPGSIPHSSEPFKLSLILIQSCVSHLTSITIFYATIIFMYLLPNSSHSLNTDKFASVFYVVVIPMLNPLIYSLRNQEVKNALKRIIEKFHLAIK